MLRTSPCLRPPAAAKATPAHSHLRPRPFHRQPTSRRRSVCVQAAVKKTYTSFDDMLANSPTPLLVEFYATWCGPCQLMNDVLKGVSGSLKNAVQVVKIDTEKYPAIASRYGIQALPTTILFVGGQPVDRIEGVLPQQQLQMRVVAKLPRPA